MTTQASPQKPAIEVQEDFNWKALSQEEKKKKLEQLHMESKILNTIDLAMEKKRILERDQKKMSDFSTLKEKQEKARVLPLHPAQKNPRTRGQASDHSEEQPRRDHGSHPQADPRVQQDKTRLLGRTAEAQRDLQHLQTRQRKDDPAFSRENEAESSQQIAVSRSDTGMAETGRSTSRRKRVRRRASFLHHSRSTCCSRRSTTSTCRWCVLENRLRQKSWTGDSG